MCIVAMSDMDIPVCINNNLTAMANAHNVNVKLFAYAASLYNELCRIGIIDRMKEIRQLGAIQIKKKYIKTRYDYTMLQLYYHQLAYRNLNTELQFSYGNTVKGKDFSNAINFDCEKSPSIYDIVQMFTIIYNAGHFYPTFVASRAAIQVALDNDAFREMLRNSSSDPRFSAIVARLINDRDYHKFHLLNSLLILDGCNQDVAAISICRELIYAFFGDHKTKKEAYIFGLIKIIRDISYISFDLQIAHSALRIDLNNDAAILELLKERIIEYNNSAPAHNLIVSIKKILDDTVYNENSNALVLYEVTRSIVRKIESNINWEGKSYFQDFFIDKKSALNIRMPQRKKFYERNILKLTFGSDELRYADQLIDALEHMRYVQVGFYNRDNGARTVIVAIAKKCYDKTKAAFATLRKTVSILRSMPTSDTYDDRYLLIAKFFLFFLFCQNRVKLKPTVNDKCMFCCRGHKQRINIMHNWITVQDASLDSKHECSVMLAVFEKDGRNDTVLALPCSVLIMDGESSGKTYVECDGLAIFPTRESEQVVIFEAKNRKQKPKRGLSDLKFKIDKLGIPNVTTVQLGYDAKAVITV